MKALWTLPLLLLGCATSRTAAEPAQSLWSPEPPAPKAPHVDPRTFAQQFARSGECEQAARDIRARWPQHGWVALKSCLSMPDHLALGRIIQNWANELRQQPDGALVLARIVALRGGDVSDDLRMMHDYKLPLFSLEDAVRAPNVYEGQLVLLRARLKEVRTEGGAATAKLEETALASEEMAPRQEGFALVTHHEFGGYADYSGVPAGFYTTPSRHGLRGSQSRAYYSRRFDNVTVDTGRYALAKMAQPDPFLEPEGEMIVLARFDGMRELDSDDGDAMPMLTLVTFEQPGALQIR